MEEKKLDNKYLFEKQKQTMETLVKSGAISKEQYEYSLKCLKEKMKIK